MSGMPSVANTLLACELILVTTLTIIFYGLKSITG